MTAERRRDPPSINRPDNRIASRCMSHEGDGRAPSPYQPPGWIFMRILVVVGFSSLFLLTVAAGAARPQAWRVSGVGRPATGLPSPGVAVADAGGLRINPHSDLIFRATGATTCRDCHRPDKGGGATGQVLDNALVRELRAKATGIHGPGRFADCLRCHAGGKKGVEKYMK